MSIFVLVLFSGIYAIDSSLPSKTGLETISDDPENIGSREWKDTVYATNQNYDLTEECLPATDVCTHEYEKFVSDDCRSGFTCVRVTDCPNNGNEEYWGKWEITCQVWNHEWYDEERSTCVSAILCPQTKSHENCEVEWVYDGSSGFFDDVFDNGDSFCRVDSGKPESPYSYGSWSRLTRRCVTELKTVVKTFEVLSNRPNQHVLSVDDQTGDLEYSPSNAFLTDDSQFVACIDDNNKIVPGFKNPGQPPHYATNQTKKCGNLWQGILCKSNYDNYYDL